MFISNSVADTLRFGRKLAGYLQKGDCLALSGELGSGKTVLAKGIAEGLGICKSSIISPTFVLLRIYDGKKLCLHHFDFYRMTSTGEIIGAGFEEYFYGDGVTVIEWPERLGCLMPKLHLRIKLSIKGKSRRHIALLARGRHYEELIRGIDEDSRA